MMALRRGGFTSRGNRHIHLTGTGMPLCGVAFETGPRSASVVQSMAVRTRSHPSDPFPLRDVAFPRPPLLHAPIVDWRSEEHTSELQSQSNLVCRLLLEKKKQT